MDRYDLEYFTAIHDDIYEELVKKHHNFFINEFLPTIESPEDKLFFIDLKLKIEEFFEKNKMLSGTTMLAHYKITNKNEYEGFIKIADQEFTANCKQYATELNHFLFSYGVKTLIVNAKPNHAFNLIEYKDEIYVVDAWHGQLISKLDDSFIKNGSLYGMFEIDARAKDLALFHNIQDGNIDNVSDCIDNINKLIKKNKSILDKRIKEEIKVDKENLFLRDNIKEIKSIYDFAEIDWNFDSIEKDIKLSNAQSINDNECVIC